MRTIKKVIFSVLILSTLYGCAVKKYVPEGEFLFRGGKIHLKTSEKIEDQGYLQDELEEVLYPEPNSKFLGMYPALHYYYVYHEKEHNFWRKFMYNKMGEKPAYFSDMSVDDTKDILRNRLENNGLYHSKIENETKIDSSAKTATVDYTISVSKPYKIKNFIFEPDSLDPAPLNEAIGESLKESLIEEGQDFSLKNYKEERGRIDQYLKDHGYYYFNQDFLLFQADTNQYANREFDLFLKLKEDTPEKAKYPYVIDSIDIWASVYNDTVYGKQDTVRVDDINIIQSENNRVFKPEQLRPFVLLEPGEYYNSESSRYTSRRLSNIGTYKFVNIQYTESDTLVDSLGNRHLKNTIALSPLPKRRIQLNMEGVTKSNDFTGPGISANYTNRNIFKGGENFSLESKFGYEQQFSRKFSGERSISLGLKASLLFPRLLFPWQFGHEFRYAIPKTRVSIGVDYLNRSHLYSLNSYSGSFGYIWDQNRFVNHQLNLVKIDYVKLSHTSDRFNEILDENPFLRRSFEQQFIAGLTYSFTYNQLNEPDKRGRFYFQFNFDIAGNTLSLLGKKKEGEESKTFLGLRYAQYAKADIDVSYHYDLDRKRRQTLVGHIFAGYGKAYGNSKSLPFVKQYFAGGPYSLRAFRIRGIGPGTYEPAPGEYSYFDQAGDIRLEANAEYRFPIISFLKGALFVDAGNVWLEKNNESLPGGKFSKKFYEELGIGTGFGLRVDIQGFVIRFDLSSSLKTPTTPWDFDYKNPMFNFGIGYPF